MTATEEWTPQTFVAARRARLARIAAAAKREAPIVAVVAEPAPMKIPPRIKPAIKPAPSPSPPRPPMPTWFKMMSGHREPTILAIQAEVAADYGVTLNSLVSEHREAHIVLVRHVAIFLCKVMTRHSLPQIGRRFGRRDHTTVLHAIHKIGRLIQTDADLAARIERIRARLTMAGDAR